MVALKCRQWCILFSRIFHERGGSPRFRKHKGAPVIREIVAEEILPREGA